MSLDELDELRLGTYKNAKLYKERTKKYYDRGIVRKELIPGEKALIFNSRLKLFHGKTPHEMGRTF